MFVKVLSGFSLGGGLDANPGEILEVDDKQAADLMYRRYVCAASPKEAAAHLASVAKRKAAEAKAAAEAEAEARAQAEAEGKAAAKAEATAKAEAERLAKEKAGSGGSGGGAGS